ncbi:MAG: hypothetical protein BZ137_09260 [Methanosphaera sp. rholeuAM130]|nr:MAG: hypothetical protein BZ137_09260 [Methanosphaera sp. rholeuAM130]
MSIDELKKEMEQTLNKVKIHNLINFDDNPQENVKVSIIIPIYNNEIYLNQCVESAINQTLEEIEIICVNDGSTDNSLDILKDYAKKDKRVKIIDKDNSGYGHVMNLGMDMAIGEYIGILESDDYILPEMYETLYNAAKEYELDFVKSDFYRFYGEEESLVTDLNKIARADDNYNTIITPREFQESFKFIMNTWNGIYSADFLRNNMIRHNETPGASFQDNGFWFKANIYAEKTMYLPEAFYMNRRDNPNSSVYNPEKVYCANDEYKMIYEYLENNGLKEEFMEVYNYKKYHTYMFTLDRIAPKFRREYIHSISKEFKESEDKNELYSRYLSPSEWNNILWIIRDPDEFYYEMNKKNIKVSVILPVYNVGNYLDECLTSLINQTLKEIEIICINDGSTDNSLDIIKKFQNIDQRVKLVDQENKGAGYARNVGIDISQGEYLSFLDADDYFDKDMLKHAYNNAIRTSSDICIYEAWLYENSTGEKTRCTYGVRKNLLPKKEVFNRRDINSNIFTSIMGWAWDKLYKKSFVLNNNLQFQEQRTTNDMYFVFASLLKAGKISILNERLYYQRRNVPTSLSNSRELSWECFYNALVKVKKELIDMNIYEEYEQDFINYALHSCLWNFNSLREPTANKLFKRLRTKWFHDFEITKHDEEYFSNKHEYNQYLEIMSIPLYDKDAYNSYKLNYWKNKYNNDVNNSFMSTEVQIDEKETLTVAQMKEKLIWNRQQKALFERRYNNKEKEFNKLVKDGEHERQILNEIRNSKSYKLARAMSYIPRKIRGHN